MTGEKKPSIKRTIDEIKSVYSPFCSKIGATDPELADVYNGPLDVLVSELEKKIYVMKDDGNLLSIGKYDSENKKIYFNQRNLKKLLSSENKNAYFSLTSDIFDVLKDYYKFLDYEFVFKEEVVKN